MPYKFTPAEKEELRRKYQENINTINSYIPEQYENYRLQPNWKAFDKFVNDPQKAWMYKKGMEIRARELKKKDIQEALARKFDHLKDPNKIYGLGRFFHTELIPSDDPEAQAYNEAKYKMYMEHPEAVVQRRMQKVFNASVQELAQIAKCKDRDALMLAWAERNSDIVESAFEAFGTITKWPNDMLTPAMQKNLSSVVRNYEPLFDAAETYRRVNEGFPVLHNSIVQEQEFILGGTDFSQEHPDLDKWISGNEKIKADIAMKGKMLSEFFGALEKNHIDVSKPGALGEWTVKTNSQKEPQISLSSWIKDKKPGTLEKLSPEEAAETKKIFNSDFTKEEGYKEPEIPAKFKAITLEKARDDLIYKYCIANDLKISEVEDGGFYKIAESIKGGVKERVFGTTSLEYKHVIQTLKDYDNEKHVAHHNPKPVKIAANQYLIHKGVKAREEAMALPYPAKERSLLCFDLIEEFQKAEPVNEDKLIPGTNEVVKGPHKEWPPAIHDKNEVEDNLIQDEPQNNAPQVEKKAEKNIDEAKKDEPEIQEIQAN
ncbi:MAG: hypothetical protein IJU64_03460 [Bacilli bacterium]|nr:hypothetical protein [Bacilli bacterium]